MLSKQILGLGLVLLIFSLIFRGSTLASLESFAMFLVFFGIGVQIVELGKERN